MLQDYVDPIDFHKIMLKLRDFFINHQNFIECYVANRLSILSACEDVQSLATFKYLDQLWALSQTGQVWLESIILNDEAHRAYCCLTTSYREEKNPVPGRHNYCFPLYEFEHPCDNINNLIETEKSLLIHLGFDPSTFVEVEYMDMCKKYGVTEITHVEEGYMYSDYGPVIFLKHFPEQESFWNMKRLDDGLVAKVDVIICGHETIGSAVRSCDPADMRERFSTISNGEYAQTLYDIFGTERVNQELEDYLKLNFTPRCGAGIGLTRLITSCKKLGLL